MEKTFLIIDSHALIHRAYHALPPLVSPDGTMVNGVYGFLLVLFKLLEEIKPDYIAAAFDLPGPTVRHQAFKEYKAKRVKAPENFFDQIKIVKEILSNWPIPILEKEGYEADDVIGTLVEKFKGDKDLKIIILTGDLDTLQLVEENVFVYTLSHGLKEKMIYNVEKVKERYHLSPSQLVDFKALKGDPSDNVLGVEKVGEKTAQKLIQAYGSLDNLYQSIEKGEKIPVSDKILESLK
ncbi:MAG TPA: 5'-3' exonuclease H3TH domain-containing protein, partial [Candidatus Paceibacterota bacterium]|nr:5'-3' exonuclease H3TH domain-containing protein [Candidatus Paceibacterota bacterium]